MGIANLHRMTEEERNAALGITPEEEPKEEEPKKEKKK